VQNSYSGLLIGQTLVQSRRSSTLDTLTFFHHRVKPSTPLVWCSIPGPSTCPLSRIWDSVTCLLHSCQPGFLYARPQPICHSGTSPPQRVLLPIPPVLQNLNLDFALELGSQEKFRHHASARLCKNLDYILNKCSCLFTPYPAPFYP
jgi:hypothetical protein